MVVGCLPTAVTSYFMSGGSVSRMNTGTAEAGQPLVNPTRRKLTPVCGSRCWDQGTSPVQSQLVCAVCRGAVPHVWPRWRDS